jgi:hypothetical protein
LCWNNCLLLNCNQVQHCPWGGKWPSFMLWALNSHQVLCVMYPSIYHLSCYHMLI